MIISFSDLNENYEDDLLKSFVILLSMVLAVSTVTF